MNTTDLKSRLMAAAEAEWQDNNTDELRKLLLVLVDCVVEQAEVIEQSMMCLCQPISRVCDRCHALTATQARLQKWVGE